MCCRGTKQERAAERDEQWEAQQEVLKRRRGNLWQNVSVLLSQQYIELIQECHWASCMPLFQDSPHDNIAKHADCCRLCPQIVSARQLKGNIWLD